VRRQIASAINLIVQVQRLRDGSRRVTHVTEIAGMEGEVVTLQDLVLFELTGEDSNGRLQGVHRSTGLRPQFWERASYFGLADQLSEALEEAGAASA
jgi:pilus assembly protein CpaF